LISRSIANRALTRATASIAIGVAFGSPLWFYGLVIGGLSRLFARPKAAAALDIAAGEKTVVMVHAVSAPCAQP